MPKRQRWTPVRGTRNRIYDPWERLLIGALDLPGRTAAALAGWVGLRSTLRLDPATIREVLVLRLDRIGDVLMSFPALADLRAALPAARIRLAVGRWSEAIARSAPVDELLVWSAPWVGRAAEGAEDLKALARRARSLRAVPLDLAIDLQGDLRANLLLSLSGARFRVGYANTGAAYLLTHVVPLDETVSFVEQNRQAVRVALGGEIEVRSAVPLTDADRDFAQRLFETLGLERRRPIVAVHPSGGRLVKQWPIERWAEVVCRLQSELGATALITGSESDRPLAAALAKRLRDRPYDMSGRLNVRETLAVIERLDLFLSPDTGPMHMACAVDTPCVAVFGPSDPRRYFSGGAYQGRPLVSGPATEEGAPPAGSPRPRQVVVKPDLWCSPCNLIRKPPGECRGPEPPECLRLVSVEAVHAEAVRLLAEFGRLQHEA